PAAPLGAGEPLPTIPPEPPSSQHLPERFLSAHRGLRIEPALEKGGDRGQHVPHRDILQTGAPRTLLQRALFRVPTRLLGEVRDVALRTGRIPLQIYVRRWLTVAAVPGGAEERHRRHAKGGGNAQGARVRPHGNVGEREGGGELAKRPARPYARPLPDEPGDALRLPGIRADWHDDVCTVAFAESPAQRTPALLRPALHLHPRIR